MSEMNVDSIRRRLVEIDDEIRALPADSFKAKYELSIEGDHLRASLGELLESELDAASDAWSERSARKASHTPDDDLERAKAAIPSPLHSN